MRAGEAKCPAATSKTLFWEQSCRSYKGSPLAREVRSWHSYLQNQTKSYIAETGPTETIQYGKAADQYEKEADLMRNGVKTVKGAAASNEIK